MTLKKESSNIAIFALIFSAMYWVGKKLDGSLLGQILGRGK